MTIDEYMAALKTERLAKGKNWFWFPAQIGGVSVELKSYSHTYLQIFRLNGVDYAGGLGMDCKVKAWESYIRASLEKAAAIVAGRAAS